MGRRVGFHDPTRPDSILLGFFLAQFHGSNFHSPFPSLIQIPNIISRLKIHFPPSSPNTIKFSFPDSLTGSIHSPSKVIYYHCNINHKDCKSSHPIHVQSPQLGFILPTYIGLLTGQFSGLLHPHPLKIFRPRNINQQGEKQLR